jgi:hypothetical protein
MNATIPQPQHATLLQALGSAFSDRLYFDLVLPHNLAAELGAEQIAVAHKAGSWPSADWAQRSLAQAAADLAKLRRSIRMSASVALTLLALGLVLAAVFGKVHPSLPADPGKVAALVGATLLTWGAVLQLYPARASWRGAMLHEVAHSLLARVLLIVGSVLAVLGGLWWQ